MPAPHVLLFDLYAGGHHYFYVQQLVRYWAAHRLPGRLGVVVPPHFTAQHPEVAALAEQHADAGVYLHTLPEPLAVQTPRRFALLRNDRDHGRWLRHAVETLRPTHAVLLYLDHAQLSLAAGLRFPFPVSLSGIYFRPNFHYHQFEGAQAPSPKERLQHLRKRVVLRGALRNPHFDVLFCLDPYVVLPLQAAQRAARVVALPDGIEAPSTPAPDPTLRARHGVAPGRKLALLFGALAERKGIFAVLEAVRRLTPAQQRQLSVLMAGCVAPLDREALAAALRQPCEAQVLLEDRFLDDEEIQPMVATSDLVLLPYPRHVGSSGVLVRAAAAGVPVLGSAYGVVGEHLRRHHLGLAVDAADPDALAAGLARLLDAPDAFPFDPEHARRFAEHHTAERFAATLFHHLGLPVPAP